MMIQASELRVGNWAEIYSAPRIFKSEKGICQVEAMTLHYMGYDGEIKLRGIPLTPKILLASGIFFKPPEWIKSVHEFQNWYYWTNNKREIEIKFT